MDQKQMDALVAVPKKFCDGTILAHNQEFFILALTSGNQADVFALTPENAKRVSKQLANAIAAFEKETRKIEETPPIPSPIKPEDLGRK